MSKLKIIIIILLAGIAGILLVLTLRKKTATLPAPSATPLPSINNPASNIIIRGSLPIVSLPSTASQFTATDPPPQTTASFITSSFEVGPPEITILPNGDQKFSWNLPVGELNYYAKNRSLSYFYPQSLDSLFSPQEEPAIITTSDAFIRSHIPLQTPLNYSLSKITYLKSNEAMGTQVDSLDLANTVQLEYRYLLDQIPLYLKPLEQADIVVLVNPSGVRSLRAKIPPTFTKSGKSEPLITRSQIIEQLRAQNYSLIKVNKDQYYGEGSLFNVNQLTITNIGLGYLFAENQLTPIFVLSGTAPHTTDTTTTYILELAINATNP